MSFVSWRRPCRHRRLAVLASVVLGAVTVFPRAAAGQEQPPKPPGPLSRAHTALEGPDGCAMCHGEKNQAEAARCLQCHDPIAERIAARRGVHREVTDLCGGCHVEHGGLDADLYFLDPESFDHKEETGFPRDGRHLAVECNECHRERSYLTLQPACSACHADAHQGQLGVNCAACHTTAVPFALARTAIDHTTTRFPLQGRHLAVPCAACHQQGALRGTPTRCYDCHWVRRQDDRYRTRLGTDCESCHRPTSWTAVTWDHASATGVQLNPAHRLLGCDGCHKDETFKGTGFTCDSCHREDFARAANPNHAAAGFPQTCETCHRPGHASWEQAVFRHEAAFPLTGAHATQACASCHRSGVYLGTPRECVGCHRADYDRVQSPNHAAAGFPTTCDTCHGSGSTTWRGASFNHAATYQLVGTHATQACSSCHRNNVYAGTPRDCVGCHQAAYDATKTPNHAAAGFPTACETCHRPSDTSWAGGTFNHATVFALVGVHAAQACTACHRNNVYAGTPRDCVGCHRDDYDRSQSPDHAAGGFPATCETCHRASDTSWAGGTFNHASVFALVGVHATQACTACHVNNVYRGTPRDCVGCHRADYDRTQSPNHVAAGFPTSCDSCHAASSPDWRSSFNHNAFYPLLGRHLEAPCSACHQNNVYRGTPRECYPCHQVNYNQAQDPNHVAAGFPTTCEICHQPTLPGWQSTFNHASVFALVGVHATQACTACHVNNVYRGTPRDCVGCHRDDYDRAQDPNHIAAGFPTTCEICHRAADLSWQEGRLDHVWFPITSGPHSGHPCSACHTDPANFKVFTCLTCHDRNKTNSIHAKNPAYRYESAACYACHPLGRG